MSDSLFTTHRYEIEIEKFHEEYYLVVFSDVHRFAYNCDVDGWKRFLAYCKEFQKTHNVYYLGLGDYDDLASGSERKMFTHAQLHDTTIQTIDDLIAKRTLEFCEELDFMKGRLIGMIEGNHHYKFQSGETSTMKMCSYFNTKYLGGVSIIRMVFKTPSNKCAGIDIYAHHTAGSKGGGRKIGSSLNKLEDMSDVWDVDICIAGHDHKMNSGFPVRMYLDSRMKVKQKDILLVRTGSFQKGWVPDAQGYVPTFNGKPNFLGAPIIKLIPQRLQDGPRGQAVETIAIKKSLIFGDYF